MTLVPLASLAEKFIDLRDGAIKNGHGEAVIVHVEDEVLAHDSQADQSDVA